MSAECRLLHSQFHINGRRYRMRFDRRSYIYFRWYDTVDDKLPLSVMFHQVLPFSLSFSSFFGLFLMWVAQKISGIYTKHRRVIFKMFQFGFTLWINRRNKNLFRAARKRHWKSRLTAIRSEWHRVIQCSSFMHVTINIYYYFYSEEISLKCWAGLLTNLQFVKPGKQ